MQKWAGMANTSEKYFVIKQKQGRSNKPGSSHHSRGDGGDGDGSNGSGGDDETNRGL